MDNLDNNNSQNIELSENEQKMQKYLEEIYGLTREEFVSIVLWLDNFSLRFDDKDRFEKNEDALCRDFNLNANEIFGILFSHGDVFCTDYSKTQADYEFLSGRYKISKKDFAQMLKKGCVIDKKQAMGIEIGLKKRFSEQKGIPMQKILTNVIEYPNVNYVEDIAYKIDLVDKFGIKYEDINGRFGFLQMSNPDLLIRLKLMNMTNELTSSFLNVGYKTPIAKAYKLFLKLSADRILTKNGFGDEYLKLKKFADAIDESQPLSEKQIQYIDNKFARRFGDVQSAVLSLKIPEPKKMPDVQVGPVNFEPIEENNSNESKFLDGTKDSKDAIESGKQISFVKNTGDVKFKKSGQTSINANYEFVKLDPTHKHVWTYMVKNFGLSYEEYSEVARRLNMDRRNRLTEKSSEIAAVYTDVSRDYGVSKKDFGQFFKYTLYGMAQRLSLLECFGIGVQELAANNYANAAVLGVTYDQLEYMLKIASIGKVDLKENLWRLAKFRKDTFLAKYIKFYEEGEKAASMLDVPLSEREYQDIIYQKVPYYKQGNIIESRFSENFPIVSSFLEGYNENQRNLLMMVGLLIKKYGMKYNDAKITVADSPKNFNQHSNIIQEKLNALEKLGFEPLQVIYNSSILRLPKEKAMPRAVIAQYLGIDEETFLKHYYSASEAKVFARMMGALDIKPSYYYASEKVFNGITGLATEELLKAHELTIGQLSKLKQQIYERESKNQIEAVIAKNSNSGQVFNPETKLPIEYSKEEIELRDYMLKNYGIDAFAFNNKRHLIGAEGLSFLTVEQVEGLLSVLKREFDISENEEIARMFANNPFLFTSGLFEKIITRYKFFEENFEMSRSSYGKMLKHSDPSILFKEDLVETYLQLKETMQNEWRIELSKSDFGLIIKHANCGEEHGLYSFVTKAIKTLKAYQIDASEIRSRYAFLIAGDLRPLETRLMLMRLLDESLNSFLTNGCFIKPNVMAERYLLYKQGKIPKSVVFLRRGEFEKTTGIKINPDEKLTSLKRIEIIKDFVKKVGNVSFAPTDEIFEKKLREQDKGEFIIRNNDFLNYMLAEVLGADYEVVNYARNRTDGNKSTRFADVYARFMAVDKFLDSPNNYYSSESFWRKATGTSTPELKKQFSINEDTAEIIKRAYFEKFPEEAFGIDGEFAKKIKKLGTVEKQKDS